MTSSYTQKVEDKSKARICLGKITSPHGVKGLVKIFPYGEDPSLLETCKQVFTSENKNKRVSITLKNPMGKYILASIENCNSREGAEELKGTELWVSRDDLPELDNQDEFYIDDLKGLTALNQDEEKIGSIIAVQNYGAGDLLEIKPQSGSSYFVPFQNEYIMNVNLEEKTITLQNTEIFRIE